MNLIEKFKQGKAYVVRFDFVNIYSSHFSGFYTQNHIQKSDRDEKNDLGRTQRKLHGAFGMSPPSADVHLQKMQKEKENTYIKEK